MTVIRAHTGVTLSGGKIQLNMYHGISLCKKKQSNAFSRSTYRYRYGHAYIRARTDVDKKNVNELKQRKIG